MRAVGPGRAVAPGPRAARYSGARSAERVLSQDRAVALPADCVCGTSKPSRKGASRGAPRRVAGDARAARRLRRSRRADRGIAGADARPYTPGLCAEPALAYAQGLAAQGRARALCSRRGALSSGVAPCARRRRRHRAAVCARALGARTRALRPPFVLLQVAQSAHSFSVQKRENAKARKRARARALQGLRRSARAVRAPVLALWNALICMCRACPACSTLTPPPLFSAPCRTARAGLPPLRCISLRVMTRACAYLTPRAEAASVLPFAFRCAGAQGVLSRGLRSLARCRRS